MMALKRAGFTMFGWFFLLGTAGKALAQEEPSRRAEDEATPKRLEKRVQDLEKRIEKQEGALRVHWKDGLRLEDSAGNFKLKIGGRIQNDWAWIKEEDSVRNLLGEQEDGTEFRRARLYLSGDIHKSTFFKLQFDFAGGDADFKDVYLGLKRIPGVGHFKVGHFKEPFSLEELTSSNNITFMERSLPNVFAPSRNTGISIYNAELDQRMTWAAGVFRETDDFGRGQGDGGLSGTFRLTGLPWTGTDGTRMAHVGVAYSLRSPKGGLLRLRQRPEVHLADRFVDTGSFQADRLHLIGLEGALVAGRFSLQSEFVNAVARSPGTSNPTFRGVYVYTSYFLTGEHRSYNKSSGAFWGVRPKTNLLGGAKGSGALEVALRYSMINLNDELIVGGRLSSVTTGLNWYFNPNTRVMLNYVIGRLQHVGESQTFMTRFQLNF